MTASASVARSRWMRAGALGGAVGLILQAWMLTAGTWNPFAWNRQSDFYDVQARSLLDGTLAMDQRVLGIESFASGGRHFMYFGPVPALLRLPFVAFTRSLDGRLAAVSMFIALAVILLVVLRLGWRVRSRVRADADGEVSRFEAVTVGVTMFTIVGGSSLLYASSRTWVYHEAILWGVALTLASIAALMVWVDVDDVNSRRSHVWLATTSVLAMLALLTRPSVAGGALAALGLTGVMLMWRAWQQRDVPDSDTATLPTLTLLSAGVVMPVVMYSIVNWLKFRRLLGVPFDQQGYTLLSAQRQQMLAENGGTLFNWRFTPTNLISYLRPDLVGVDGTFPFLQAQRPASTFGAPTYDLIDLMSGLPVTMPFLLALGVVGAWAVARSGERLRPLRPVLIGCVLGILPVLAIGYMATRYQSDFLPFLIVSALVGLPLVTDWFEPTGSTGSPRAPGRMLGIAAAPVLIAVGLASNLALGYSYQRAYGPLARPESIAGYIGMQQRVDGWFGDGELNRLAEVDELPLGSALGDIAIVGACDGLYISDGGRPLDQPLSEWHLAELSASSGASAGLVTLDPDAELAVPLVHVGTASASFTVSVEIDRSAGVMTTVIATASTEQRGPDLPLRTGRPIAWQAFADPFVGRLEVYLDGRYGAYVDIPIGLPLMTTVGHNLDDLPGVLDDATAVTSTEEIFTPVCDRLLRAGAR